MESPWALGESWRATAETMRIDQIIADPQAGHSPTRGLQTDVPASWSRSSAYCCTWETGRPSGLLTLGRQSACVYRTVNNPYARRIRQISAPAIFIRVAVGRGRVEGDQGRAEDGPPHYGFRPPRRTPRRVRDLYDAPYFLYHLRQGRETVYHPSAMIARRTGAGLWMCAAGAWKGQPLRDRIEGAARPAHAQSRRGRQWATAEVTRQSKPGYAKRLSSGCGRTAVESCTLAHCYEGRERPWRQTSRGP